MVVSWAGLAVTNAPLSLDIDVSGLNDVVADVDAFPQDVGRELTIAMESSLQLLEGQVKTRTPVNVGKLRDSIGHSIISQFPNLIGQVGTPLVYGIVMEEGRKPGARMPPVDAIKLWVVRKLGIPADEAEGVAWAVAKSIAKKGIEGKHMFKEGLEVSEPHINTLFDNAIARSVARFNAS